jgi:hypothetical protein
MGQEGAVTTTASNKIGRQMMQRKQVADESGAEDDQTYLPRVFFL